MRSLKHAGLVFGILGLIAIAAIAVIGLDVSTASHHALPAIMAIAAAPAVDLDGVAAEIKTAVETLTKTTSDALTKVQGDLVDQKKRNDELEAKMNAMNLGGGNIQMTVGGAMVPLISKARLDEEHKAVASYARTGSETELKSVQSNSVGFDPGGGYFVLPVMAQTMIKKIFDQSPMRQLARVETITIGDAWEEPIDKNDIGATWVGEKETRSKTDVATFGMLRVPVNEIYALQSITQRLIDDASIDLGAWIEGKVSDKFARTEAGACVVGDGVLKPKGFLAYDAATTSDATRPWGVLQYVSAGVANAAAFIALNAGATDVLKTLLWSLRTPYRKDAAWLMNSNTASVIDKLKDGQGNYVWQHGMTAGAVPTLLGYPVVFDETMPDIATGSTPIAFGNFKQGYLIVDKAGIRMLRDPYTDKPNVLFYGYRRVGGGLANSEAIKVLKFS
jgi:HK97 family phage major capsid protein